MKRRFILLPAVSLLIALLLPYPCWSAGDPNPGEPKESAGFRIEQIELADPNKAVLVLKGLAQKESETLRVNGPALQGALKHFSKGDLVDVVRDEKDKTFLKQISVQTRHPTVTARIFALIVAGGIMAVFSLVLLRNRTKFLIVGKDNRYSNSKFQIVVWFYLLITTYVATLILRGTQGGLEFVGGIDIPQNLLMLSGLSAFTFAAAKGITQGQVAANPNSKIAAPNPNFPADLFQDDLECIDLGDFQTVIITLLAAITYLISILNFFSVVELRAVLHLPDVDTTILAVFGLGQGAYLVKKYAGG
ncbi:MAG: hypothetical protein AB9866_23610 [Syntrophobacteraceae bacterium]